MYSHSSSGLNRTTDNNWLENNITVQFIPEKVCFSMFPVLIYLNTSPILNRTANSHFSIQTLQCNLFPETAHSTTYISSTHLLALKVHFQQDLFCEIRYQHCSVIYSQRIVVSTFPVLSICTQAPLLNRNTDKYFESRNEHYSFTYPRIKALKKEKFPCKLNNLFA